MIKIKRREFEKGWARARSLYSNGVAAPPVNNAHRLMLFYAIENGLKALIMQLEKIKDGDADFSIEQHNLNHLLDRVKAAKALRITGSIVIKDQISQSNRGCHVGQINQMWRYGCIAETPSDADLEGQLNKVAQWIEEQISSN